MTLWGGRFSATPAEAVFNLSRSVHFDWRLAPYDLVSSMAHLAGLKRNGLINDDSAARIDKALLALLNDVKNGQFVPVAEDEDVHSALERGLLERLGDEGGLLRAGRSRNDQVVTDLKLYLLDSLTSVSLEVSALAKALLERAEEFSGLISPGFTHLQHAQPITFGQELAKHAFALERDLSRIEDWRVRTNLLPLGSGALAGSSLVPDPENTAISLGFSETVGNSIDGVSDRDFVAEALFILSLIGSHLSRLGEEFTLFASSEYGWVQVDDAYSTGSSIMPQKRNPDVAELARGKAGRLLGNLVTLMTVLKGLPFAYNRDLQEDKEPIFDSVDTLLLLLPPITGMVKTARFNRDRISSGNIAGFALATEVADYLVRRSIPFSQAHEIAGRAVRLAESLDLGLEGLSIEQYRSIHESFNDDIYDVLSANGAVSTRTSVMGTSSTSVLRANAALLKQLDEHDKETREAIKMVEKVMNP